MLAFRVFKLLSPHVLASETLGAHKEDFSRVRDARRGAGGGGGGGPKQAVLYLPSHWSGVEIVQSVLMELADLESSHYEC